MVRPSGFVVVIWLNPFKFFTEPSGFSCKFDTFAPGLLKCGVLLRLRASARSWSLNLSVTGKLRKRLISRLLLPGPRSRLKPEVPKRAGDTGGPGTGAYASGSKYA